MQTGTRIENLREIRVIPFEKAGAMSFWHRFNVFDLYMWPNLIFLAIGLPVTYNGVMDFLISRSPNNDLLLYVETIAAGLILSLILLVVHEVIHLIAYRLCHVTDAKLRFQRQHFGPIPGVAIACGVPDRRVSARITLIVALAPTALSLMSLAGCWLAPTAELRLVSAWFLVVNASGSGWDWFMASMTQREKTIAFWEDNTVRKELIAYSQI